MLVIWICAFLGGVLAQENNTRTGKTFSLFSIVQFPNEVCTSASSTTTYGTCYTSSECTTAGGSADGNCAAGFGVCCIIHTSTCATTISTNTTYIRNPGYPSSYTPSATGSCKYTINKVQDDICQLRLDFQSFSGLATSTTVGLCTDYITVAGQTGKNPPAICGTNTGYHMYAEFGATATDTATVTFTYGSTTTAKLFNILLTQISCTAAWRAPTDCAQYFTGSAGNIKSYNFAGGQLLNAQYYTNCIRTEAGYCGIMWKESSTSSPDPFQMTKSPITNAGSGNPTACAATFIYIPNLSPDGISSLPVPVSLQEKYSTMCGGAFGLDGKAIPLALVSRQQPFILGVYTDTTTALTAPTTGFSLDYTQVPC